MIDIDLLRSYAQDSVLVSSVIKLESTASTNTYAKSKEIPCGTLIITENQLQGKGRMGRKWISEPECNLTFSIKTKLPLSPAQNHFAVFFFSYQLYSAIKKTFSGMLPENEIKNVQLKWPNDIMFGEKKLSGILIESVLPEGEYIIGIGVNCNQDAFSDDLNAVSLKQILGIEIDLTGLLLSILKEFSENFSQLEAKKNEEIFELWKKSTAIIGKNCEYQVNQHSVNIGKITDLNDDGSISIENEGNVVKYYSGNIKITGFN